MKKYLIVLFVALALPACSTYAARIHGEDLTMTATSSPVAVEASGKNMTGEITRDGKPFLSMPGQPYTGTIRWEKGKGWTVTPLPARVTSIL